MDQGFFLAILNQNQPGDINRDILISILNHLEKQMILIILRNV